MNARADIRRESRSIAVFQLGFRPFFFGAALFAGIALPVWLAALALGAGAPSHLAGRDWHVHEMVFGYLPGVLAGFLLTAIPNWTGRLPVAGKPLATLFGLWLAGRVAIAVSAGWPVLATTIDTAFLVALAGLAWREVIAGKTWRNVPVCVLLTLLAVAHIGFDLASLVGGRTGPYERGALSVIALLISLIGGRITPSFTRNWLAKTGRTPLPVPFGRFDRVTLAATAIALLAWTIAPHDISTGVLFALAAVLHLIRVLRWIGWRTLPEPLVTILHIGYAWLAVWFALTAWSILLPGALDGSTALHALTAGAIGTMTLAVMTRATLGHTGRPLTADAATVAIYALVIGGAAGRIVAPFLPVDYLAAVLTAGALWSAAFLLFSVVYGRYLLAGAPRSHRS